MVKKISYFDFEEDLEVIHNKIEELELDTSISDTDRTSRLSQLKRSYAKRLSEIYSNLTDWQITQLARHPARPYTLDYIQAIFSDFTELHGDRMFADDASIVAGLAHLGKHAVAVIGHVFKLGFAYGKHRYLGACENSVEHDENQLEQQQ